MFSFHLVSSVALENSMEHVLLGDWMRKKGSLSGSEGEHQVRSLGHAAGVPPTPLQETRHRLMLINNFIPVTIAGTLPAKCTEKRGIAVLIQGPMSYMGQRMRRQHQSCGVRP